MRKQHGLNKYKCDHYNFHSDDQSYVRTHDKSLPENEWFKCKNYEYTTNVKSNLHRHIRSKHIEKNVKWEQCDFVTDRNDILKIYVQTRHILKKWNECEYTILSLQQLKKNICIININLTIFKKKSALNKLFYQKTWKLRGVRNPLSFL